MVDNITNEEKDFLEGIEDAESTLTPEFQKEIMQAADNHMNKKVKKRITITVSEYDILKVKQKAEDVAIPYQTIIGSLVHQYAEGKIEIKI